MSTQKKGSLLKQVFVNQTHGYLDVISKRELFSEISKLYNGDFVIKHTPGNVLTTFSISIPYKKWVIELTESDTRPLKFQISIETQIDFELIISWEDAIEKILKMFGKPEIQLGLKEFDDHYLVKSNKPDLAKRVLSVEIQKILLLYNVPAISIIKENNNITILRSVISRSFDDKKSYTDIIQLHQLLIDKLEQVNVIK
jgi:hypothetical protein